MKTIETTAIIGKDRELALQWPPDISPGRRRVVLVIEELASPTKGDLDDFPTIHVGPWPAGLSLRREDMYGDDERCSGSPAQTKTRPSHE